MEPKNKKLLMDVLVVFCLLVVIATSIYIFKNVEALKADPCGYCMEKTSKVCYDMVIGGVQ